VAPAGADVLVVALSPDAVGKLLGDLLGVEVTVRGGGRPSDGAGLAGLYVDGTGRHSAGVWFDRALAGCVGAALAKLPLDAAAAGTLPDDVAERTGEALTVFSTLLNAGRRVKLESTVRTPPAPVALGDLLAGQVDPSWFTVAVEGFGSGVALVLQARTGLGAAA
jgi:hypothetical protein